MKFEKLPCLKSSSVIKIKKGSIPGMYFFVKDGARYGFFRQTGNIWIWYLKPNVRRYGSLSDLFEDAGKMI